MRRGPARGAREARGPLAAGRTARTGPVARVAVALGLLAATGCVGAASGPDASVPPAAADALVPPGYGTLLQDDVTLTLRSGDLQVKVTPLAESVIRLTAPDTYRRLHGLAESHRAALARQAGREDLRLFLVSFFSMAPDVPYEPEALEISSRGFRHGPLAIRPVTPGWGAQRLEQRETLQAVYAFSPGVDLEADLSVEYQGFRTDAWRRILTDLQAERERVRARAGIGGGGIDDAAIRDRAGPAQSRSYFRILR